MISKKLMSELMNDKVKSISIMNNTIFIYFENNNQEYFIDIYELAYKCKVWAYKRGFLIGSNCRQGITVIDINTHTVLNHFDVDIEDFTEFEIKACQWILENK